MATLKVLGCGSAFCSGLQSMYAIEVGGKYLILDFGQSAWFALEAANIRLDDIEGIYVSHLHGDHTGGLERAAFSSLGRTPQERIWLYGQTTLLRQLWSNSLSGGLKYHPEGTVGIDRYFNLEPMLVRRSYEWRGVRFRLVRVNHGSKMPVFGLRIIGPFGVRVFWSADTIFDEALLKPHWEWANIIIQDACGGPVHASIAELRALSSYLREKMWLTHLPDELAPYNAFNDGFAGKLAPGKEFYL